MSSWWSRWHPEMGGVDFASPNKSARRVARQAQKSRLGCFALAFVETFHRICQALVCMNVMKTQNIINGI